MYIYTHIYICVCVYICVYMHVYTWYDIPRVATQLVSEILHCTKLLLVLITVIRVINTPTVPYNTSIIVVCSYTLFVQIMSISLLTIHLACSCYCK